MRAGIGDFTECVFVFVGCLSTPDYSGLQNCVCVCQRLLCVECLLEFDRDYN